MSIIEVIDLGCSIVSAATDAAPLVKKWIAKKDSRRKARRRSHRRARSLVQEESDRDNTRLGPRSSIEDEIGSGNFKDLIQAQVVSTLHSILNEVSVKNDRFDGISVDSETQPVPALADQVWRMSLEAPPRALSFPTPNCRQQGAVKGPPSRASSFSILEPSSRMSVETPPLRTFSYPVSNQYRWESLESPPLRASSFSVPDPSQPMSPRTPLLRASTFPLSNQSWNESLKPRPRASSIPMPDQWRRSLKSPPSALSSPTLSEASTIAYSHSPGGSFLDILGLDLLPRLLPYLNDVPIQHLIHHAATWFYPQTLDQLLYPDQFYLKGDAVMKRSYLSSNMRSHICVLAYTVSESTAQGQAFTLVIFLTRFIMQHGTHLLIDAPRQFEDPTGLRELESRYDVAREISGLLEANE